LAALAGQPLFEGCVGALFEVRGDLKEFAEHWGLPHYHSGCWLCKARGPARWPRPQSPQRAGSRGLVSGPSASVPDPRGLLPRRPGLPGAAPASLAARKSIAPRCRRRARRSASGRQSCQPCAGPCVHLRSARASQCGMRMR
jgi:hypothetical protein